MVCSFRLTPSRLRLAFFAMAAFVSPALFGANYYVATNGSDNNSGSSTSPFATLQRGVNAARAGDTVFVRNGTYGHVNAVTGGDSANYAATPVILYYSGTSSAWITIKAENKWGAVLDCEMICDSYIDLRNASYVSIEGFVITRGYKEGIHSNNAAHHINLRNNRIEYIANRTTSTTIGQDGLYTNPNCHDFIIDGNVFHNIGRTNELHYDHALYLRGWNFTVTNNVFYNNTRGWSIQLAEGVSNVLIANNTFAFPNPNKDGHIMLWNTQTGLTIQNNIFYSPRNYAIDRYASTVSSCSIDRNIIYGASGVMASTSGCSLSNNQIGANPQFVNANGFDFHVQSGGAGVDAGTNLAAVAVDHDGVSRPQGGSTDIGAFEYNAPAGPVISGIFVTSILSNSAVINWSTDRAATSYVDYGVGALSSRTTETTLLTTIHSVVLTGLSPATQYRFRVGSRDSGGRLSVSNESTFTTQAAAIAASFSLSRSPASLTLQRGQGGSASVQATLVSGNPGPATFRATSVPSGVTVAFSSNSCTPTCSTTATFTVSQTAGTGTFNIGITADAATTSASTSIALTVASSTASNTTSGLAGLWYFEEGRGSTTADSSGNGNRAVLQRATWSRTGCTSCLWFSGSASQLTVAESSSLRLTSQMTVTMWVRAGASTGSDPRLISKLYDWDVKLNGSQRYPQFSAAGKHAMMSQPLPIGQWQHIVFTFSAGTVTAYLNGSRVSLSQNTFTGSETLPVYPYGLFMGSFGDGTGFYTGFLDDVRIYSRALAATDVAALYTQTRH